MSLPASRIVAVSPRVISGGGSDLETNGLLLTKNTVLPASTPAVAFSSTADVSAMFGAEAEETAFAQQYFSGVQNQQSAPKSLVIARRVTEADGAWIRGGELSVTLEALKKITDGSFKISVGGQDKKAASINLSSAASLSDAATKIATAISGVKGTYDSNLNAFTFTTDTKGKAATIGYASKSDSGTDLSEMLGLTQAAVVSQGVDAMTEAANMEAVCAVTRNWVGFTTLWEAELEEIEALAAWADIYDDFVYFPWSSDKNLESTLTASNGALAKIVDKYDVVVPIYFPTWGLSAMAMACGASIAWNRTQGMKTWFAKYASGLSPNVLEESVANALESNRINFIGQYATRNDQFQFFNRGTLSSDFYGFVDVLYGSIYLRSAIQTSCMSGFKNVNRVPYNAAGEALIRAWCQDPINRCIMQETGDDGEDVIRAITSKGYWLGITLPDAAGRANREAPSVTIFYAYAGSVQALSAEVIAVI